MCRLATMPLWAVMLPGKCLNVVGSLVAVCLLFAPGVHGQSEARLEGTVFDASGAPIVGADVTVFAGERVMAKKTNQAGVFEFTVIPANARFIEASSPGFASDSRALTEKRPEQVSFVLSPGTFSGVTLPCSPPSDLPPPSASYEERRDKAQLTGSVASPSGAPVADASLTLSKADLDARSDTGPHPRRASMRQRVRPSTEVVISRGVSNAKGEFQFTELDPGWYTLEATRDGYSDGFVQFWVARENLTRLSRIYLVGCR
jgi:protocatechuate 3,4-dioxygenase beta subunit